jgi:uncharacterized protein YlxW (UPF0749 family)
VAVACALLSFVLVVAVRGQQRVPGARVADSYRLSDLIADQQRTSRQLQAEVEDLRRRVESERQAAAPSGDTRSQSALDSVGAAVGLAEVRGAGLKVTLDDAATPDTAPGSDVNDFVIHSQDLQSVVNALWRAGATAVAIDGQRLVATSAVLCVGNTLLLNGTVQSPPYVALAVGAGKEPFEADALVRRLHQDADTFGLRFSVDRADKLDLPGFAGPTTPRYASPA